jgi:hypothetical protein
MLCTAGVAPTAVLEKVTLPGDRLTTGTEPAPGDPLELFEVGKEHVPQPMTHNKLTRITTNSKQWKCLISVSFNKLIGTRRLNVHLWWPRST